MLLLLLRGAVLCVAAAAVFASVCVSGDDGVGAYPGSTAFGGHVVEWMPSSGVGEVAVPLPRYVSSATGLLHPAGLVVGWYSNVTMVRYTDGSQVFETTTGGTVGRRVVDSRASLIGGGAPFSSDEGCKPQWQCLASYTVSDAGLRKDWSTPFVDGPGYTSWSVFLYDSQVDDEHTYMIGQYTSQKIELATGKVVGSVTSDYIAFANSFLCGDASSESAAKYLVKYGADNSLNLQLDVADTAGSMTSYTPSLFGIVTPGSPSLVCGASTMLYGSMSPSINSPTYMFAYDMDTQSQVWKNESLALASFVASNAVVRDSKGRDILLCRWYGDKQSYVGIDGATGHILWTTPVPDAFYISSLYVRSASSVLFVGGPEVGSLRVIDVNPGTGEIHEFATFAAANVTAVQSIFGQGSDGLYAIYTSGTDGAGKIGITALHLV